MADIVLRSCATHGGHWAGYTTRGSLELPGGGEPWFCPKCLMKQAEQNAAWTPAGRDRCHRIGRTTGPFSDLLVVEVTGEQVTVQPLGFPDMRETVHRAELVPGRFGIR